MSMHSALASDEEASLNVAPKVHPRASRSVLVKVLGSVGLLGCGYALGAMSVPALRGANYGAVIDDTLLSKVQWEAAYTSHVQSMSAQQIVAVNTDIMASTCDPTWDATRKELCDWYKSQAAGDSTIMTHCHTTMNDALRAAGQATTPHPKTGPSPTSSSISSYSEFGHLYSHETAGKPWPQITKIDQLVRETHLAVGASLAVKNLNHWYHHHATAAERKDFDDNAVAHMMSGKTH